MDIRTCSVVLASGSPRRKELLEQVGVSFSVMPAKGTEIIRSAVPSEAVLALSRDKAAETAAKCRAGTLIIGADTVVACENRILGKPEDEEHALKMLRLLRNGCHSVYTGVTIIYKGTKRDTVRQFVSETKVTVYDMSDEEMIAYIATGEPMDKAGAYGIQGRFAAYVKQIEGDYYNVVGLPVSRLLQEVKEMEAL